MKLRPATLYLDEVGHVYLPLLGPAGACLRLNARASQLWRQWLSAPVDESALLAPEKRLLDELLGKGALARAGEGAVA